MTRQEKNVDEAGLRMDLWKREELLAIAETLKLRALNEGGVAGARLAEFPRHYTEITYRCASGTGELHAHFADTFFILAGSATLVTGGKLVDAKKIAPGEARGSSITGETRQRVDEGMVVHIPAGLAHQMVLDSHETITYFVMKIQESEVNGS